MFSNSGRQASSTFSSIFPHHLLGTLDTSLRGLRTRKDLKIVRSKGSEDSAVIVNILNKYGDCFKENNSFEPNFPLMKVFFSTKKVTIFQASKRTAFKKD